MKARVVNKKSKYYGKIVNVKKMEDTQFFANRYEMIYGKGVFFGDELEFNTEKEQNTNFDIDWQAFRREAAKEILANMLSCPTTMNLGEKAIKTVGDYVSFAIGLADELIKQLRDGS